MIVTGKKVSAIFKDEPGGHRYQRIPPTEKRGRVQTSTITVAVMNPDTPKNFQIPESDIEIKPSRGSGPGGQHRNKTESCITATHIPTGVTVRVDMRSQFQSRSMAVRILTAKIYSENLEMSKNTQDKSRRDQVGSGMRGDKVRTYRAQDDRVTDHRTGKVWKLSKWSRGEW
jgi:peptide chain release factor 1